MYLYLTGPVWLLPVITLLPDRSGMTQILSQLQTGLVAIRHPLLTRPVWYKNTSLTPDRSGDY